MADVLHFIEVVLLIGLALIVLFFILLIVVSMMPNSNPLKMILSALSHRVGATAGLMVVDPLVTTLPVVGEVWDLATIIWLIYFWYTFFKQLPAIQAAASNGSSNQHGLSNGTTQSAKLIVRPGISLTSKRLPPN